MDDSRDDADIVIIGAGAAGLAAAIFAAEQDPQRSLRIALLETARKPGAKILVSGGGRCNVTHHEVLPGDFHGKKNIVRNILNSFDQRQTVEWFRTLGVELKQEDTGKLFPVTNKARTVLDALLQRCQDLGVELLPNWRVETISGDDLGWMLHGSGGQLHSRRLIAATGGKSLPKSGSDGHGWKMIQSLGHSVTDTWPALVGLLIQEDHGHQALSGISHPARLMVSVDDKTIESTTGEMLWTHTGISGPSAMDISRTWIRHNDLGHEPRMLLDLLPGHSRQDVDRWLIDGAREAPNRSILQQISGKLPRRVAEFIGTSAGLDLGCKMAQFTKESRRQLVTELTSHLLPVCGHRGWTLAEVTAGGVPLEEIAYQTMQSRIHDGLYLAGEILDCEGRIGGFNFQWAWTTGSIAGSSCARSLMRQDHTESAIEN